MTDRQSGSPDRGAGRLFVGIPVTTEIREALVQHLAPVALPGRLVPPDKWHLTLRFLGDTGHDRLARLRDVLAAVSLGAPFDIVFGALGAFPRPARASVVWLGVSHGADRLAAVASAVELAVQRAGFAAESRGFTSHLTLSRLQPARDVRPLVESAPAFSGRMPVSEVTLFRSHLGGGPSRYQVLERYPLLAGQGC